jgi:hypothetical protein
MTTMDLPKAPKSMTAYLDKHGDLPGDILLGRIVLFTISDEPVKRDDIVKWFKSLNLNEEFVPPENKAQHAFEKATSETKDVYPMTKGREGHLMCRDVSRNTNTTRRQITREIKDGKNRVLDYHRAVDLQFVKPSDPTDQGGARLRIQIDTEHLEHGEHTELKKVAEAIQTRYFRYLEFFDGMKLRAMVREYLKKQLNAIEVKGGVYFVLHQYDEELARLSQLVSRLGGECQMSMIPIVNVERERKFLTQILQREATDALATLAKEIEEAMANTDVKPATVARLQKKFAEQTEATAEHMDTLQVTKSVTTAASQRVQKLLNSLQVKAMKS